MIASERDISNRTESSRKVVIVVALIAAVVIAGLFYLLMRSGRSTGNAGPTRLEGAIRPGSPDWDKYNTLITLDAPEADEAGRALVDIVITLHTTVRNFTARPLNGLEIRAAGLDTQSPRFDKQTP